VTLLGSGVIAGRAGGDGLRSLPTTIPTLFPNGQTTRNSLFLLTVRSSRQRLSLSLNSTPAVSGVRLSYPGALLTLLRGGAKMLVRPGKWANLRKEQSSQT
jgi:hypothetical protein